MGSGVQRLILIPGAYVTMVVILRLAAMRRGRRMKADLGRDEASWGALCRVKSGGRFLDAGRSRRGGGPRGTLSVLGEKLEWVPDHGDASVVWSVEDARLLSRGRRWDLAGRFDYVRLALPQGEVTFGLIKQIGPKPAFMTG
jgi:hypothetical protein